MTKKMTFLSLFLCLYMVSHAQNSSLEKYNRQRLRINRTGMVVLGSWAIGNIAVSGALSGSKEGATQKLYEMNIYWNLVNLSLAGLGLYQAFKSDPASLSPYQSIQQQHKIEKFLLFNAGVDMGYMATGLWMWEKSKNQENNKDMLEGYGKSILLQGGFLLLFDLSMYAAHRLHWHKGADLFQHIQFTGQGIGLKWHF